MYHGIQMKGKSFLLDNAGFDWQRLALELASDIKNKHTGWLF
jgi:hypothetical protein